MSFLSHFLVTLVITSTLLLNCHVLSRRGAPEVNVHSHRESKQFTLFNVVTFQNNVCRSSSAVSGGTNRNGTCLTAAECATASGAASGSCAAGFGVCCVFIVTATSSVVSRNCTYIQNPGFPSTTTAGTAASYTVQKQSANVCQLRLDFLTFTIQGVGNTLEAMGGLCMDTFTVTEGTNQNVPVICGQNSGEHMYVDMGANAGDSVGLNFAFAGNTAMRSWDIKATQIPCGSQASAPNGCLQYHTALTGRFSSFNFADANDNHLNNQQYSVCIRQARDFCCIQYQVCPDPNSFSLGTNAAVAAMPEIAMQDVMCTLDYIGIEASSTTCSGAKSGATQSRYCGTILSSVPLAAAAAGTYMNVPICDCSSPFRVDVVTDMAADPAAGPPNVVPSRGVCLQWTQLPC